MPYCRALSWWIPYNVFVRCHPNQLCWVLVLVLELLLLTELFPSQSLYVEVLTLTLMVFGDEAFEK